jgi:SAM-dependent methyltransferase
VRFDDPALVQEEYATEDRLAGRKRAYRYAEGPNPHDAALAALKESSPSRLLEVGCGEGELAERIERELGCDVVALDQSARMVDLTRRRGVDARVGDVQELPFADEEFDCALAAWMLYHVADLDRALCELARILRPGGRLVAVTNADEGLRELIELLDVERPPLSFNGENGEQLLGRHFSRVERREAYGWIAFPDRAAAQEYVDATIVFGGQQLPAFEGALRVRRAPVVFVADKT